MANPKRFIQVPWPLGRIREGMAADQQDMVRDLATLTAPVYGMIDSEDQTWIVYHNKVLKSFARILGHLKILNLQTAFSKLFFPKGMLMAIVDRLYGSPRVTQPAPELAEGARLYLEAFAAAEMVEEVNALVARQALLATAAEFVFGIAGLTPSADPEVKRAFLSQMFAAPLRAEAFPERAAFEAGLAAVRGAVEGEAPYEAVKAGAVQAVAKLMSRGSEGDQRSREGRIIRASLRSKPLVAEAAERVLARLELEIEPAAAEAVTRALPSPGSSPISSPETIPERSLTRLDTIVLGEGSSTAGAVDIPQNVGPYVVLGEIGEGGMGRVLRASGPDGREVAIKLLKRGADNELSSLWRFVREMEIALALKHPAIVEGLDYGVSEGEAYLVLEYLSGGSLERRLKEERRLEEREVWGLIRAIAEALDYAWSHPKQYVHRDIKAANILFDGAGRAKVADFGLAAGLSPDATRFTKPGTILGTPQYMAPEQIEAEGEVDTRADLWSAGVVAYQCLSGQAPFSGSSVFKLFKAIRSSPPRAWDELKRSWSPLTRRLIERLLAKDPKARFQEPAELLEALEDLSFEADERFETKAQPERLLLSVTGAAGRTGRLVVFAGEDLPIGRNSNPPVRLCLRVLPTEKYRAKTAQISGLHGRFVYEDGAFQVIDESSNGLFLNGRRLDKNVAEPLSAGDRLDVALVLRLQLKPSSGGLLISRHDNRSDQAYLQLVGEVFLGALRPQLRGWPPLDGSLLRRGGVLYYVPRGGEAEVDGMAVEAGRGVPLSAGRKLVLPWGRIEVGEAPWSLFK